MQGTSWPLPSASKPGNLLFVLVLCCCDKALLEFLVKPLVNFYQLRKLGTLVDNTFLKVPNTLLLERPLFAHEPRSVALELSLLLLILLQLMNYPVPPGPHMEQRTEQIAGGRPSPSGDKQPEPEGDNGSPKETLSIKL